MNDIAVITFGMFAAIAPIGAVRTIMGYVNHAPGPEAPLGHGRFVWISSLIALGVFALAAILADPFLEFLDVSPESFQFAAGAVMAPFALRLLWAGDSMPQPDSSRIGPFEPWLFPAAVPLLAGPASATAALSYSARFGVGDVVIAAIPVLFVSALLLAFSESLCRALGDAGVGALGRLSGALLIIVAVELAVDGVRSV
jgi:multiple antibiotic resistance protein